jgi:hypothetical protein
MIYWRNTGNPQLVIFKKIYDGAKAIHSQNGINCCLNVDFSCIVICNRILPHDAGHWQPAISPSQLHNHKSTQPILYIVLCCYSVLFVRLGVLNASVVIIFERGSSQGSRLASNLKSCLSFLSAGIQMCTWDRDVHPHTWLKCIILQPWNLISEPLTC